MRSIGKVVTIRPVGAAAVLALSAYAFFLSVPRSNAQEADLVHRTVFGHHDQTDVPGREVITGTAELAPGAVIGWHVHSGDEAGYVLKGEVILKTRGLPDQHLKAGDSFFNVSGVPHSMIAAPGTSGGTAYSTWIVEKGKPLAQPVQP